MDLMSYDALVQDISTLPKEYFPEVAHFLELLKFKVMVQTHQQPPSLRQLGGFEGQIKIADDFDDTPADFEDYL